LVIGGATVVEDKRVIENENQYHEAVQDGVEEAGEVVDAGAVESKNLEAEKEARSFEIDEQIRIMLLKFVYGTDIPDESYFVANGFSNADQSLLFSSGFQVISKELSLAFLHVKSESAILDFVLFRTGSVLRAAVVSRIRSLFDSVELLLFKACLFEEPSR
jgi:hypothetical protein